MSKPKVLIVEDDDDLRRGLRLRLRATGYEVVEAQDGVGAISVARNERPDVVLLDIGLPGGDGFTVMTRFANLPTLAGIPIVVLTGRDPRTTEPTVRQYNVAGYLRKPADNRELADTVARALRGEPDPAAPGEQVPTNAWVG